MDNLTTSQRYYQKNKEKVKDKAKLYREKNKEKIREYDRKRPQRKQTQANRFKTRWKCAGIKCEDWDILVDKYMNITNCELCDCELVKYTMTNVNRICLEHDHLSGYVRFMCCHKCNQGIKSVDYKRQKLLLELHRYFRLNM